MNGNGRSATTKMLLFLAGMAIVALAFGLLAPYFIVGPTACAFAFVDAMVLYALLFAPLALGERISDLTGGRIVSLGVYWYALGLYALLTAYVLFGVASSLHPPLRLYLIMQLAGLFAVALAAFLGDAAHAQVDSIEMDEGQSMAPIKDMRSSSEQLVTAINQLDVTAAPALADLARTVERIADDLRYLTPVQAPEAAILESRIQANLDSLTIATGCHGGEMDDQAAVLDIARDTLALVARRKALRN